METQKNIDWNLGTTFKKIRKIDTGADNGTTYQNEQWDYYEGTDQDTWWYQWTTQAEQWLLDKYRCSKREGGRGVARKYVARNSGSPQTADGTATNSEGREWGQAKTCIHRTLCRKQNHQIKVPQEHILRDAEDQIQGVILEHRKQQQKAEQRLDTGVRIIINTSKGNSTTGPNRPNRSAGMNI